MIILTGQCINKDTILALKSNFEVITTSDIGLRTAADSKIFDYAVTHKYVLLTFDKDFGNILRFDIKNSQGIVIIYIEDLPKEKIIKHTLHFFEKFDESHLKGKLFIVDRNRVRIWPVR